MKQQRVCNTAEAKAKLNEFLHEVTQGREVVILRRGKVVAKIVPASEALKDPREEALKFMTRLRAFHRQHKKKSKGSDSVVALLREIRREAS